MHKQTIITLLAVASGCLLVQAQTRNDDPITSAPKSEKRLLRSPADEFTALDEGRLADLAKDEQDLLIAANTVQNLENSLDWKGASSTTRSKAVMVTTTQTNAETLAALEEDLSVMSLLLDKSIAASGRPNQEQMLGINISAMQGTHTPQNLYIEGQGALFVRHVKVALRPGVSPDKEKNTAKKDSAWEEAKRDLYGPKNSRIMLRMANHPVVRYDGEKVEHLTSEILGTLKNAANIRGLGANESVTVVLLGAPENLTGDVVVREGMGWEVNNKRDTTVSRLPVAQALNERATTMTIKLKKADAEAALNGSIDLAELQKRASISVY